ELQVAGAKQKNRVQHVSLFMGPERLMAVTSSTMRRSGPMKRETCWTRFFCFAPATWSSIPFWMRAEKTRPVAISPALGSIVMSVTMNEVGPDASVFDIAVPIAEPG